MQQCRKYSPARQMQVKILTVIKMQLPVRWAICNFLTDSHLNFLFIYFCVRVESATRIINARISNNLNKEFICFQRLSAILFRVSVQSPNNSFSLSATGFAEQSRFLCRVSVDFGSRLLSMVSLSKSFHNVVIFLLQ